MYPSKLGQRIARKVGNSHAKQRKERLDFLSYLLRDHQHWYKFIAAILDFMYIHFMIMLSAITTQFYFLLCNFRSSRIELLANCRRLSPTFYELYTPISRSHSHISLNFILFYFRSHVHAYNCYEI